MTLAFEPEYVDKLRSRYPAALEKLWDLNMDPDIDRPGKHRTYVFDFRGNWRLIISRQDLGEGIEIIHVSASYCSKNPPDISLNEALETITKRWKSISNHPDNYHLHLITVSEGGVIHLRVCSGPTISKGHNEYSSVES